jgi:hypothetical protein
VARFPSVIDITLSTTKRFNSITQKGYPTFCLFVGHSQEYTDHICRFFSFCILGCGSYCWHRINIIRIFQNHSISFDVLLRATAWENWHIVRKSNSHYFLLSWNSHQIFFSPYKKYKLNIFGLQNWAPPFLQGSKSAVLQFCWKRINLFKNIQNNLM